MSFLNAKTMSLFCVSFSIDIDIFSDYCQGKACFNSRRCRTVGTDCKCNDGTSPDADDECPGISHHLT